MRISAQVQNSKGSHIVTLRTNDNVHSIDIPPRSTGFGSSANGGELLRAYDRLCAPTRRA